jgi:uncharacterized protein YndB with AHSA1/START domain
MNTRTPARPDPLSIQPEGDRELCIERIFNAPRERVWRAYTDPALVARWWGRGLPTVVERLELERGGHWRFVVESPHGTQGFEGRYREVTPPERLVQTFEWDGMPGHVSVETVTFTDLGDGRTKVTSRSLFMAGDDRDAALSSGMEEGLKDSYAALDQLLAAP